MVKMIKHSGKLFLSPPTEAIFDHTGGCSVRMTLPFTRNLHVIGTEYSCAFPTVSEKKKAWYWQGEASEPCHPAQECRLEIDQEKSIRLTATVVINTTPARTIPSYTLGT